MPIHAPHHRVGGAHGQGVSYHELGLSTGQLQNILQTSNIIIPGGTVTTGVESLALEPTGSFETVEDIRRAVITLPRTREVVFLGDIVEVRRGYVDPRAESVRVTGREGLVLAISMRDGGDIIALGLLVDNAIVMSEAILIRMEEGIPAREAAIAAGRELRVPLLVSSLTTAAAFLPIALAESAVGEYTAPLAQVITITLLASWLLAITVIPMLCAIFLKVKRKPAQAAAGGEYDTPFYRSYRGLLLNVLRHPVVTVVATFGVLVVSLAGFSGCVEQSFFPEKHEVLFTGEFNLPYGTSFERTEAVVKAIEAFMQADLMPDPIGGEGLHN